MDFSLLRFAHVFPFPALEDSLNACLENGVHYIQLINRSLLPLIAESSREAFRLFLQERFSQDGQGTCDLALGSGDGITPWVRLEASGPAVEDVCHLGFVDITKRKQVEEECQRQATLLQQSENLMGLGTLAGGIAHDFNNLLATVLGLASINREGLDGSSFLAQSLDTIVTACLRGRDVVKNLMGFARKDIGVMGPVDINILAMEILHLLNATTLKTININMDLQEPLGQIYGDEASLSHALMNLCLNGRDAMPAGGSLTIRTRRLLDDRIEIRVVDTGIGMSPDVMKQAIDPFFTTKPIGKGTGLGLSMVYGTAKAHQATLEIESELGRGTEVVLRFPCFNQEMERQNQIGEEAEIDIPTWEGLRILLVDDDELIQVTVPSMLKALGHNVKVAGGGLEALELIEAGIEVDLVILDIMMPNFSGADTLPRLLALRPELPVLLTSGHSEQIIQSMLDQGPRLSFAQKPFTLGELRDKIRELAPHQKA